MFTIVESFGDPRIASGPLAGLPAQSLIEDGFTGHRWMLIDTLNVIRGRWLRCLEYGAVGAIIPVEGMVVWFTASDMNALAMASASASFVVPDRLANISETVPSRLVPDPVTPTAERRLVHLHAHSEFSPLDGLATVQEMVDAAVADSQPALAVTDHGVCAAHPEFARIATAAGVKPIFGIEANFVNARKVKEKVGDYYHLILWAENQRGLQNLWSASTEAYREGFYGRARMDWDTLARNNEGVLCSTACLRGPLSDAILADDEATVRSTLARLQALFPDRLYVELHTNQLPEQRKVNEVLVSLAQEYGLPTIVVADSHYACLSDHAAHKVWIAAQTNKDLSDEGDLFAGDEHYHISSADEVAQSIAYLGERVVAESMANTLLVADRCDVSISQRHATPVYHRKTLDNMEHGAAKDASVLLEMCEQAWQSKVGSKPDQAEYRRRLDEEMALLVNKQFCGYILLVADYCRWAKANNILMGPGRGSAAGSLVCYLTGITEVDPIEARLLFERFLTPGRTSLPDIDSDFPASKRDEITQYVIDRWGADRVVRVGTHIRLANRGVMRDVARVLSSTVEIDYRDVDAVSKIIEEAEAGTAGLGLTWEELWAQHGDELEPYRIKYPTWFDYAAKLVGRLKSYGKHAAGVVIDPESSIIDRLPLRVGETSEQPITEFAMADLEYLGYVKFDLLTLRTLDTIQMTLDLIRTDPLLGRHVPDIYSWRDEYDDPEVWDMMCRGDTLGIFQIETSTGTGLTKRFQPRSLDDLCAILTLVRPGPMRSGLTESYLRRRFGDEPVQAAHPLLETVLDKTYQAMIYQEDIMAVCRVLGGYTTEEADEVRSILGKKKVDKVLAEGHRFVARCVSNGVDRSIAEALWAQMQEFARYAFNRSHSWAYAMLAYQTAWLKAHYPVQFLTAVLSTVKKERIPDFVDEARRSGFSVLPPDINESGEGFRVASDRVSVRYGLDSVKGIGAAAVKAITQGQPYSDFHDFLARKGRACNSGHVELLARLGAFDSISGTHRASLEAWIAMSKSGELERCRWSDDSCQGPNGLPCGFNWSSEIRLGKTGKPLKPRPAPTKCTKACRNYEAADHSNWPIVPQHSDSLIRWREKETLGVFLSSTPFDDYTTEARSQDNVKTAVSMELAPQGTYLVLALVNRVRKHKDKTGKEMAFVDLLTENGVLPTVVFNEKFDLYQRDLVTDNFMWCEVSKTDRGCNILRVRPCIQHKEQIKNG